MNSSTDALTFDQDMTSTADAKRAVEEAIEKLGGIDVIVANAVRNSFIESLQLALRLNYRHEAQLTDARAGPSSQPSPI
jgi:NAD(P)-dependent dehydrogenase (short-subunit alcohol dehydrogenase family)